MSGGGEDAFFAGGPPGPERPPRREPALLARSPVFAAVAAAASLFLLSTLASDVAWFFAPRAPVDLGAPGAYRLERARENRLVQVRGPLSEEVGVTEGRRGEARTVGRLAGTTLLVDRPGPPGRAITDVYEGRLLPARDRSPYRPVADELRRRGAALPEGFAVLRDGERPRGRVLPVALSALLLAVAAVNVRALARALLR